MRPPAIGCCLAAELSIDFLLLIEEHGKRFVFDAVNARYGAGIFVVEAQSPFGYSRTNAGI
jgi:hypothetical protein